MKLFTYFRLRFFPFAFFRFAFFRFAFFRGRFFPEIYISARRCEFAFFRVVAFFRCVSLFAYFRSLFSAFSGLFPRHFFLFAYFRSLFSALSGLFRARKIGDSTSQPDIGPRGSPVPLKVMEGAWSSHGAGPGLVTERGLVQSRNEASSHGKGPGLVMERGPVCKKIKDLTSQPDMGPRGSPVPLKSHGRGLV